MHSYKLIAECFVKYISTQKNAFDPKSYNPKVGAIKVKYNTIKIFINKFKKYSNIE